MKTQNQTNLFNRPADRNFDAMDALLTEAEREMNDSREVRVPSSSVLFHYNEDDESLRMSMEGVDPLSLTHYSLSQVAGMAKIPVPMIERLYAKNERVLIIDNLNALFPTRSQDIKMALIRDFMNEDDEVESSQIRAVNGSAYSRLWDYEVFSEADEWLMARGFTPEIPPLRSNAMRSQLMYQDRVGLYRGDQTSFGFFFVKQEDEMATHLGGLRPGLMMWTSEVGARSFGYQPFYYHMASGSIIIWTPANHKRKRFVHRGNIQNGFKEYLATLEDTAENFEDRFISDINVFNEAATTSFAPNRDAAVQKLRESFDVPAVDAKHLVEVAFKPQNAFGDELSVWRMALAVANRYPSNTPTS